MDPLLSPRSVADAIGVSESSLKRWADEGLLRVSRTAGGHRRIALHEALRYIREAGIPIVRPEALGLPQLPPEASSHVAVNERDAFLIDNVQRGEPFGARTALLSRYLGGESMASLCDGPLREALHNVGELWHHGPEGIHIEHRAVDVCVHALHYVRGFLATPVEGASLALGGGAAGDPYIVPSLMAATVLAAEGWREINLGPNVPAAALTAAIRKFRPRLIWMSFSTQQAAEAALCEMKEPVELAGKLGASFIAGGRCAPPRGLLAPASFHLLPSMEALVGFARGLTAAQPAAEQP
ncbi:MAG: MerR family transcriptional regulator [Opitutales bacterium]